MQSWYLLEGPAMQAPKPDTGSLLAGICLPAVAAAPMSPIVEDQRRPTRRRCGSAECCRFRSPVHFVDIYIYARTPRTIAAARTARSTLTIGCPTLCPTLPQTLPNTMPSSSTRFRYGPSAVWSAAEIDRLHAGGERLVPTAETTV